MAYEKMHAWLKVNGYQILATWKSFCSVKILGRTIAIPVNLSGKTSPDAGGNNANFDAIAKLRKAVTKAASRLVGFLEISVGSRLCG